MIPDNVEKIIMTKEDYDRNVEQLLVEKLELEQELQRKDNIINELKEWLDSAEKMNSFDEYDLGVYKGYKATLDKIKELESK